MYHFCYQRIFWIYYKKIRSDYNWILLDILVGHIILLFLWLLKCYFNFSLNTFYSVSHHYPDIILHFYLKKKTIPDGSCFLHVVMCWILLILTPFAFKNYYLACSDCLKKLENNWRGSIEFSNFFQNCRKQSFSNKLKTFEIG